MGGDDRISPIFAHADEGSFVEVKHLKCSSGLFDLRSGRLGSDNGEFDKLGCQDTLEPLDYSIERFRSMRDFKRLMSSYEELQRRSEKLEEAKSKILRYRPGAWIGKAGGMKLSDYNVPVTTAFLLIGPRGSGKSSLVNKISRVFDTDRSTSERAQVSYNSHFGEGTYFLSEYIIPRDSTAFSLFDTRGLSEDSLENMRELKQWMTKGVRHGQQVRRDSDNLIFKAEMQSRACRTGRFSSKIRIVNFVILVVNGLSILKTINGGDEAENRYIQMIVATFKNPLLSFKDDKPVIVVTHGDLISLTDRAKVRLYLAELLGIPPMTQIFDIPENDDPATELAIIDMLHYCLEHADRNLPVRGMIMSKVFASSVVQYLLVILVLGIAVVSAYMRSANPFRSQKPQSALSSDQIDWNSIRHLWLG